MARPARPIRFAAIGALALIVGAPLPASAASVLGATTEIGAVIWLQTSEQADDEAVLSRQGAEGMAALRRLTAVEVSNPLPTTEATIDFGATATAEAAATATAGANVDATATAAAVAATMATEAGSVASTATAVARQEAGASATAEAGQRAAERATAEARQRAATATARARQATPAAAVMAAIPPTAGDAPAVDRAALLPVALLPPLASLLGVAIWRRQREPFLLKAKPTR